MKKTFASALMFLLLAAPAFAQDGEAGATVTDETFNVTAPVPADWTVNEDNDRAVFNFVNDASHSQIEVIGTELVTAEVADVFFDTFHETLVSSEFLQLGREDKSVGDYSGTETIYGFSHSGVTLKVAVFQFVRDTTAWIAVGYMQEDLFDEQSATYRELIGQLSFE